MYIYVYICIYIYSLKFHEHAHFSQLLGFKVFPVSPGVTKKSPGAPVSREAYLVSIFFRAGRCVAMGQMGSQGIKGSKAEICDPEKSHPNR